MPYLWIDPPGPDVGVAYELAEPEQAVELLARLHLPADNAERARAFDLDPANMELTVAEYQSRRDFYGVTMLEQLPTDVDLPVDRSMMGAPDRKEGTR